MLLSPACVNIFKTADRCFPFLLPFKFIFTYESVQVVPNPFFVSNQSLGKTIWHAVQGLRLIVILTSFLQMSTIISCWSSYRDFAGLCYFCTLFSCTLCCWSCAQALFTFSNDICYLTSQRFKLVPIDNDKTGIYSMLVYAFTWSFSGCPVFFAAMPFVVKYFDSKPFLHKVIASVSSSFVSSHGIVTFSTLFLLSIIYVEAFTHMFHLTYKTDKSGDPIKPNFYAFSVRSSSASFQSALRQYRCIQYLIQCMDIIARRVSFEIVAVGTIVVAWCGYVTVTMYNEFPFFLYVSCASICIAGFVTNTAFVTLGASPQTKSVQFKIYWNQAKRKLRKLHRLELKACPELSLNIGGINNVRQETSLLIADTYLNCIATLVLMKITG